MEIFSLQCRDTADRAVVCQELLSCEIGRLLGHRFWERACVNISSHPLTFIQSLASIQGVFHFFNMAISFVIDSVLHTSMDFPFFPPFPFLMLSFCLALQEQIIKGSLLQGALEKNPTILPEVIWSGAVKFANCWFSVLGLHSLEAKQSLGAGGLGQHGHSIWTVCPSGSCAFIYGEPFRLPFWFTKPLITSQCMFETKNTVPEAIGRYETTVGIWTLI